MQEQAQSENKGVLAARILLVLDLAFCLFVCVAGVRNALSPPTTLCGRPPASVHDAIVVLVLVVPVTLLGGRLLWKPTRLGYQTILAVLAMVALTVLAVVPPLGYIFQNGFCLSPF